MDISREDLHEKMWTDGIGKTEKALGLRQDELRKICTEFQIPRPSSSYWNALYLGKPVEKTPLPTMENDRPIHTEDYIKHRRVKKEKPSPAPPEPSKKNPEGKYEPQELPEEKPATVYTVPETLYLKDPILLDTKAKLLEKNSRQDNPWSEKNPYKSTPKKWLDINVYKGQEDRAIRVFYTIWRAAESRGYHLQIKVSDNGYTCTTFFIVRDYHIRVQLKEINQRIKDDSQTWASWTWSSTGKLKFLCERETHRYYNDDRVAAQDTEHTRIEDKIEHIIDVLEQIADARDQAKIERIKAEEERKKEEERRHQEEERQRLEAEEKARIEALREEERVRVSSLLFESERLKTATIIREYAAQYEAFMTGRMEPQELKDKLQWMKEKADFIDPFIHLEDPLLKAADITKLLSPEIIKTTEERRHTSYGSETVYSYWQIKNMWWRR